MTKNYDCSKTSVQTSSLFHRSSLPTSTPSMRNATKYTAAGMTKPCSAAGTEAAAVIFISDGVDDTVSDKASLRSLAPSVYSTTNSSYNQQYGVKSPMQSGFCPWVEVFLLTETLTPAVSVSSGQKIFVAVDDFGLILFRNKILLLNYSTLRCAFY